MKSEAYTPKLFTVFREGYSAAAFRAGREFLAESGADDELLEEIFT